MACECRDEDGELSKLCRGCHKEIIFNHEQQTRAMEDSFTIPQLQQIKTIVREALSVSLEINRIWIDGFLKGFDEGKNYGD